MDKVTVDYYVDRLGQLRNDKKIVSEDIPKRANIFEWVCDCVDLFSLIGVEQIILDGFINFFEMAQDGAVEMQDNRRKQIWNSWINPGRRADRIDGFYFPRLAFQDADSKLKVLRKNELLVPNILVEKLLNKTSAPHIASQLNDMERHFQSTDAGALLQASHAVLTSIVDLSKHPDLNKKKNLKAKLIEIEKNEALHTEFGLNKNNVETVWLLHSYRYLRNVKMAHVKTVLPNITFISALGFANIILHFLYSVMAAGQLIK